LAPFALSARCENAALAIFQAALRLIDGRVAEQRAIEESDVTTQHDKAFARCYQYAGMGCEKYDRRREIFGTEAVIPLWVADMDFAAPDCVVDALADRVRQAAFGYACRMPGWSAAISDWLRERHQWQIAPEWLISTAGVVPSLALAIQQFTVEGEGVIIQPPVYFPFFGVVTDNRRRLLCNPLREVSGRYQMDFDQLEKLLPEAAMLLLCNPHNPGGRAWTAEELSRLAELCARHGVMVISDEIHMDLHYPGQRHIPFAKVAGDTPFMTVTSAGKTFNTAGIGGGYTVVPDPDIRRAYLQAQQALHLGGETVFALLAVEAAYREGKDWPAALMAQVAANRDRVLDACRDLPIRPMMPEATYLLWLDCREMGLSDQALVDFFVYQAGLGLSPGRLFGKQGSGFMRMNLASPASVIDEALRRLRVAFSARTG